jgi:acyl transferase domain-containing protein
VSSIRRAVRARDARRREPHPDILREPIAVLGMACRLPGEVRNPEDLFELLIAGKEAITEIPAERGWPDTLYDPDPERRGSFYTRRGGFVSRVDRFEAGFFRMSPQEVRAVDPQHRMLLELSWEAIEQSGISPLALKGSRTGVFMGLTTSDYAQVMASAGLVATTNPFASTGNVAAAASGRIAYFLGLQGPSLTVDTACSSSLVAAHLACQSLQAGEIDLALVGGANLMLRPEVTILLCGARALSVKGRCRAFDASADGYVRGEGGGVVVLRRLSDAIEREEPIAAVIRSTAVNQDGRSAGFTAPNPEAQQRVIQDALARAGIDGEAISYIEAHGTGTPLGDPIEFGALSQTIGQAGSSRCWLGSVKPNIGHLEAGAGIASLIKVAVMLKRRRIAPHPNFETPNPQIDLRGTRLRIPTEPVAWEVDGPRLACLNSFGFTGTNAHAVLEEAPPVYRAQPKLKRSHQILAVSAPSPEVRRALVNAYRGRLERAADETEFQDACFTANVGRAHFRHRAAFLASSRAGMLDQLASFSDDKASAEPFPTTPRVAFVFPGQGAQYGGMGAELYESHPVFRESIDRCARALEPALDIELKELLFGDRAELHRTDYTQPALVAIEWALASMWQSFGVEPALLLGHSIGQLAAACVAEMIGIEDVLALAVERGRLMHGVKQDGAMAVVFAGPDVARTVLLRSGADCVIAAYNGPASVVISGPRDGVAATCEAFKQAGVETRSLRVSQAFHSPLMDEIGAAFTAAAARVRWADGRIPVVSNLDGAVLDSTDVDAAYWARHLREPVRFDAGVATLVERGCDVFLEVGPGTTGISLARQCVSDASARHWLASIKPRRSEAQTLLDSVRTFYEWNGDLDWEVIERGLGRVRVGAPSYPFDGRPLWITKGGMEAAPAAPAPAAPALAAPALAAPALAAPAPAAPVPPVRAPLELVPRAGQPAAAAPSGRGAVVAAHALRQLAAFERLMAGQIAALRGRLVSTGPPYALEPTPTHAGHAGPEGDGGVSPGSKQGESG